MSMFYQPRTSCCRSGTGLSGRSKRTSVTRFSRIGLTFAWTYLDMQGDMSTCQYTTDTLRDVINTVTFSSSMPCPNIVSAVWKLVHLNTLKQNCIAWSVILFAARVAQCVPATCRKRSRWLGYGWIESTMRHETLSQKATGTGWWPFKQSKDKQSILLILIAHHFLRPTSETVAVATNYLEYR